METTIIRSMMKDFLDNNSSIMKAWITVVFVLLFIITLPIMIVVAPAVAAYEVANKIMKKKESKKPMTTFTLFGEDGLFGSNNMWGNH